MMAGSLRLQMSMSTRFVLRHQVSDLRSFGTFYRRSGMCFHSASSSLDSNEKSQQYRPHSTSRHLVGSPAPVTVHPTQKSSPAIRSTRPFQSTSSVIDHHGHHKARGQASPPPKINLPGGEKDYAIMLDYIRKTPKNMLSQASVASGWFALSKTVNPMHGPLTDEERMTSMKSLADWQKEVLTKLISISADRSFNRNQTLKIFHAIATAKLVNYDQRVHDIVKRLYFSALDKAQGNVVDLLLKDVTPHQFANSVMIFARMNKISTAIPSASIVRQVVSEVTDRDFLGFNLRDIATMTWSVTTVGSSDNADDVRLTKRAIEEVCKRGFEGFTPQSLSALTWSLATMEVRHEPFVHLLAQHILSVNFKTFNEQDVSNIIWSYAKFGYWNPSLMEALDADLQRRGLSGFNFQGIANLLTSLVKLNVPEDYPEASERIFKMVTEEIKKRDLRHSISQTVSNIAWAYGTAGVFAPTVFYHLADDVLRRGVKTLSPQNISNLLVGFAKAGFRHDALLEEIAASIKRDSLEGYTSQGISNVLWSYAKFDKQDLGMLRRLVDEMRQRGFDEFIPQAIANVVWSLAKLGRFYDRDIMAKIIQVVRARGLENVEAQYVSNLMWSLATFNVRDTELLKIVPEAAKAGLRNATFQSIVNIAWSFACLDQLREPAVREFFESSLPVTIPMEFIGEVALQLHQCKLAWLQSHPETLELPHLLTGLIGDGKWVDAIVKSKNDTNEPSSSHKDISRVLKEMGYDDLVDEYVTPNGLSADIMIRLPNNERMLVEVDGPFHFLSDDITPTGATVFKRRLLAGEGFKTLSVNVKMCWRWLRSKEEQKAYLADLIEESKKKSLEDFK